MKKIIGVLMIAISMLFATATENKAQTRERSEIEDSFKWQLEDMYASVADWNKTKDELAQEIDVLASKKGTLANSAKDLADALKLSTDITKEFYKLYSYASMSYDEDTGNSETMALRQQMQQLGTQFGAKTSWIEPEILSMDPEKVKSFIDSEKGLETYKFYLNDLLRRQKHTLSEKEETILAQSSMMASTPNDIYGVFSNSELPYPEVTLSDGTTVTLNKSNYSLYRASTNREDREIVFDAFFGALSKFKNTFGTQLYGEVKTNLFYARTRGYNSSLERALDANNIPTDVYLKLIENVNNNLDSFHRYLKLKQRMLGVDTLKYCDIYAPVVEGLDLNFDYNQAQDMVLASLEPLGDEYKNVVRKAFDERWIDVYPTPGKRSGAYSNGSAYDIHPYILLNYNGKYDDVSTLIHELGHTMHSYYSNHAQPFETSDYSIFVAEVASTFNEALLIHDQLEKIKDDKVRLTLLMNYLDGLKGTVFRQAQFAEFELKIHEAVENNQPLTGDTLTKMYADIVRRYYGHDKGVCIVDDTWTSEWAYIPHFYYNFYVYQYSTSFTASTALSEKVINGEKGAVEKYLKFISSGGSDYPINQLKDAGVDMTTSDPFNKTMEKMNKVIDEIEDILAKNVL